MAFGDKKSNPARDSGMRGYQRPTMSPAEGDRIHDEENAGENESSEEQDNLAKIMAQHIHGPDDEGHHHLNLTTFAEHIVKNGGLKDQ